MWEGKSPTNSPTHPHTEWEIFNIESLTHRDRQIVWPLCIGNTGNLSSRKIRLLANITKSGYSWRDIQCLALLPAVHPESIKLTFARAKSCRRLQPRCTSDFMATAIRTSLLLSPATKIQKTWKSCQLSSTVNLMFMCVRTCELTFDCLFLKNKFYVLYKLPSTAVMMMSTWIFWRRNFFFCCCHGYCKSASVHAFLNVF